MEKRNRRRISELTHNIEIAKDNLAERENEIHNIIDPYIRNMEDGTDEDIAKLIEIRQAMLGIQDDYMFRQVTDALKGKDTGIAHVDGWLDGEIVKALRFAVNQYEFRKIVLNEHEHALAKYIGQYVARRDGYHNLEMLNELIGMLPDCRARYNLMASREYLYR